jgi:small ligand-binding sensory domain FIST
MKDAQVGSARAVVVQNGDWREATKEACQQLAGFGSIDLLFMFASDSYGNQLEDLVQAIYRESGARSLLGCTGQGIIGQARELEDEAALALLALSLPGIELFPVHLTQDSLVQADAATLPVLTHTTSLEVNGWILLADPYTLDPEQMIALFSEAYPGLPVVGGMASGDFRQQRTYLFLNDRVLKEGALALPVGGDYTLKTVVSQGAMPVGEAWMVTAAERNIIFSISGRPAYEVLIETFRGLTPERQEQARRNLLVGLAVDEYKAEFGRGDFLIRNLMALDPASGAIAISAEPRIGQTIQFQLRDSAAADEDLRELLGKVTPALENNPPLAGVVFSCNGRGQGLFGTPDHDAHAINEQLGSLPLAGFFCNGEIGPVGSQTFLHGFTASLGLFVKK